MADFFRFSLILSIISLLNLQSVYSQSFIGVCYGGVADNLPPVESTVKLLRSTTIEKVRMYAPDPAMMRALANTGLSIVIGVSNGEIRALASDKKWSVQWISQNVLPFFPSSKITMITVGNEVLTSNVDSAALTSLLLPAMINLQESLDSVLPGHLIKISTVHSMAVLSRSDPPSSGMFNPEIAGVMKDLLKFQKENGSPLSINPYPFFAYQSDPRAETLAFCLFQPNSGRVDSITGLKYSNMFDAQVDAVHSALSAVGFPDMDITVAETGWPYKGGDGEVGPSIDNAKAYNGNLIAHLRSGVGTPLIPGKSVDTFIFALFDEDLKPGPAFERSFGLFKPDLSMTYDSGLLYNGQVCTTKPSILYITEVHHYQQNPIFLQIRPPGAAVGNNYTMKKPHSWCVPKVGVPHVKLQSNIDYACGHGGVDCVAIQAGGVCFEPDTVESHAAFVMNEYYQKTRKNPSDCDFLQTAALTSVNPSYRGCVYTGGKIP